jgi:hypothetical protein
VVVWIGSSFRYRNLPWVNNLDLFSLKISWNVAGTFVKRAALTVLSPGFRNVCRDSKDQGGDRFHHFGYFFVFNSFDDTICSNDRQDLVPARIVDQQFYSCRLFATLACAMTKIHAFIARTGGGCSAG